MDHIKHRIGIEIAWHHIKHGLSSIINFFEPPGVREEVERLEGDEIVMVVVVMVVAVGRGRNRGRQRSNRRRGCYCPWWQLRFVRVGSERGTCKDDGEWREGVADLLMFSVRFVANLGTKPLIAGTEMMQATPPSPLNQIPKSLS